MAPLTQKPQTLAGAIEANYEGGGPSQLWKSACPHCTWMAMGRSQRAVIAGRSDHVALAHPPLESQHG